MANVFRSKEVYKNFRYDIDKTKKVVAVQGVYVASEYRPPYYNEPGIHIYEISGQHCTIADFKTEEAETQGMKTAGMYMLDIVDSGYRLDIYGKKSSNSTPEPILRLSSLTSEACVVENYT